jgi:hypothetical protein
MTIQINTDTIDTPLPPCYLLRDPEGDYIHLQLHSCFGFSEPEYVPLHLPSSSMADRFTYQSALIMAEYLTEYCSSQIQVVCLPEYVNSFFNGAAFL